MTICNKYYSHERVLTEGEEEIELSNALDSLYEMQQSFWDISPVCFTFGLLVRLIRERLQDSFPPLLSCSWFLSRSLCRAMLAALALSRRFSTGSNLRTCGMLACSSSFSKI